CNDQVKFRPLLAHAEELGADKLVTGHYARIEEGDEGYELHRGEDRNKDQSYFLYRLSQDQLSKILFPLGGMEKPAVRAHADRLGLGERVSEKTESQEICFVGPEGYAAKVEDILDHKGVPGPGDIVNREGKVLGRHKGIHHHTLGQRRGLGIAASAPLYVQDIKAKENQVVVGFKDELLCESVEVQNLVWPRSHPKDGTQIEIQQRYREYAKAARIWHLDEDRVRIVFDEPTPLGAPGQAAVFYQGSKVVGGGTIAPRSRIGEEGSGAEKS
ncbi:tRNA 2-thiouridine(34) synthase MnmA, partial [Myxococcota bacterium]|nr:tRNA 2-thiouridine(34) synthase MnmA [Myxococcota bacterium]